MLRSRWQDVGRHHLAVILQRRLVGEVKDLAVEVKRSESFGVPVRTCKVVEQRSDDIGGPVSACGAGIWNGAEVGLVESGLVVPRRLPSIRWVADGQRGGAFMTGSWRLGVAVC